MDLPLKHRPLPDLEANTAYIVEDHKYIELASQKMLGQIAMMRFVFGRNSALEVRTTDDELRWLRDQLNGMYPAEQDPPKDAM